MNEKVLHVSCGGLGYGGVSSVILSIVESLHDTFEFGCVVFNSRGGREKIFEKYGNIYRINAYSVNGKRKISEIIFRPFRLYSGIKRICRDNHYDVIHCHNNTEEGICLLAAKHAGIPIRIAHSHNTTSPKKRAVIFRIIEIINKRMMLKNATAFVGCSDAACNAFFGECNHSVIYNAIDFSCYRFEDKDAKNRNGKTFIHVGRYTYQKNQEFVIRVFKELLKANNEFKLFLIGYGEDEAKLKKLVQNLDVENNVIFVDGKNADIVSYYRDSDYMIFPSRYEGFGIVLLEAQSMKIRCFVSDAIQKEADVGLITYLKLEQSAEEWADAIIRCISKQDGIDDEILKSKLKKYSCSDVADKYKELYRGKI